MEFAFTDGQEMIRESADNFLQDVSTSKAVRVAMAAEQDFDAGLRESICLAMYWQALSIPEEYGGLGLGYVERAILFEEMGRRLLCSPFFSTVGLGNSEVSAEQTGYVRTIVSSEGEVPFQVKVSFQGKPCVIRVIGVMQFNEQGRIIPIVLSNSRYEHEDLSLKARRREEP